MRVDCPLLVPDPTSWCGLEKGYFAFWNITTRCEVIILSLSMHAAFGFPKNVAVRNVQFLSFFNVSQSLNFGMRG